MHQFRTVITCLVVFFIAGCKSNHEQHNAGIGRGYSFTSFNLTSSTGATFTFSTAEMRELEKVWSRPITSKALTITNTLIGSSPKLAYSFVLNDGYAETSEAYLGTVSGIDYLGLTLQGDGGGFMADVYTKLVPLTPVFSATRRSNLSAALGNLAAPVEPIEKVGEQAADGDADEAP